MISLQSYERNDSPILMKPERSWPVMNNEKLSHYLHGPKQITSVDRSLFNDYDGHYHWTCWSLYGYRTATVPVPRACRDPQLAVPTEIGVSI